MAARKPASKAVQNDAPPVVIAIHEVNMKDLGKIVQFADTQTRAHEATVETERALSVLVREADEIAQLAGDIHADEGSAVERERHARKIKRLNETLGKVRASVAELAAV